MQDTKSIYRNLLHFYTLIINYQKRNQENNPIHHHIKNNKYVEIYLTMKVKELYSEKYKTVMKEIEDTRNKWKDVSSSWIGRINIIKMSILPKQSTDSIQPL